MKNKVKFSPFTVILAVFMILVSVSLIYLLLWALMTSVKSQEEFRLNRLGFPKDFQFSNLQYVFSKFYVAVTDENGAQQFYMIEGMLLNSLLYVVGCSLMQTLTPCIVAYATTKFSYKFNGVVKTIVLVVMALPIVGAQASELSVLNQLGLYDTMWGIWIQKMFFANMYYFVFCAAFQVVSKSFYEAAYMDGANEFTVMIRIAFPMVVYTFGTVFLLHFISFWNDYQSNILYIPSWPTLSYGLFKMSRSVDQKLNTVPMRMAGCMLIMIPTLLIYVIFNNRLMGNISLGGVKE